MKKGLYLLPILNVLLIAAGIVYIVPSGAIPPSFIDTALATGDLPKIKNLMYAMHSSYSMLGGFFLVCSLLLIINSVIILRLLKSSK